MHWLLSELHDRCLRSVYGVKSADFCSGLIFCSFEVWGNGGFIHTSLSLANSLACSSSPALQHACISLQLASSSWFYWLWYLILEPHFKSCKMHHEINSCSRTESGIVLKQKSPSTRLHLWNVNEMKVNTSFIMHKLWGLVYPTNSYCISCIASHHAAHRWLAPNPYEWVTGFHSVHKLASSVAWSTVSY